MADPIKGISVETGGKTPGQNEVSYWTREIELAQERDDRWRKRAKEVLQIYEDEKLSEGTFNVLYSNTETLRPALYNALPRAYVKRRFKSASAVSRAVAETLERSLDYFLDSPSGKYSPGDDVFQDAVQGALLPGRGVTRVRYDAEISEPDSDDSKSGDPQESVEAPEDEPEEAQEPRPLGVSSEAVAFENVPYDRFLLGYARVWKNVPWVGFLHKMTKADVRENFGPALAEQLSYTESSLNELDKKERAGGADKERNEGAARTVVVWEIWVKQKKSVIFLIPSFKDRIVKRISDPLGLTGFFPVPQPLQFTKKFNNFVPIPLYDLYREQAKELNRVSIRIQKVTEAMKVRGFYNSQIRNLPDLLQEGDDNDIFPADNLAALMDSSLDKHIWLMPLEKLQQVLQQLLIARENAKQTIYEITGISDILRGASVASETATAQNIKNQWGTLRLKSMQRKVQLYIRDVLRIASEVMANKFGVETYAKITGLPFVREQEKQQAQMFLQQAAPKAQELQQSAQQDPAAAAAMQQLQQAMQKAQQTAQSITWEQVGQTLQDELALSYNVDIETNSSIDADATDDKQAVAELTDAVGRFLQATGPLMQAQLLPPAAVKGMLAAIVRKYQFGPEVEEYIEQMPDQPPQQNVNPEELQKREEALKEAEQELKMSQRELDMNKKFAIKEVEFEKKVAMEEVKSAQKAASMEVKMQKDAAGQELGAQAQQATQELALQHKDQMGKQALDRKGAEQSIRLKSQEARGPQQTEIDRAVAEMNDDLKQVLQAVLASNQGIQQAIQQLVAAQSAEQEVELVKTPDGKKVARRRRAAKEQPSG